MFLVLFYPICDENQINELNHLFLRLTEQDFGFVGIKFTWFEILYGIFGNQYLKEFGMH